MGDILQIRFIDFILKIQFYTIKIYCICLNIDLKTEIDKLKVGRKLIKFKKGTDKNPAKWYLILYFKI